MKRLGLAVLVALTLAIASPYPAQAKPSRPERFLAWVNEVRSPDVRRVTTLNRLARKNSRRMAEAQAISHSQLSCYCGEIVGTAPSGALRSMFVAFMESRSHRPIILDGRYRKVGIGVVERGGILYLTAIFA